MYEGVIVEKLPPECEACRRQRELQESENSCLTLQKLMNAINWFTEEVNHSHV